MTINKQRVIWGGFLVIILISIAIVLFSKKKTTDDAFEILTPSVGDIVVQIISAGEIQPQNRLEIIPPINGRLEEVLVVEGEKVRKGQILAYMSASERAALIDAAQSQGAAAVAYWEKAYKKTPLISPINGTIIVRNIEPGQSVNTQTPVLVVADRLVIKAKVDETDIGQIKKGQQAYVILDAYPQSEIQSQVDHIAYESTILNNVTVYEVDVAPQKLPAVAKSGMSVEAKFVVAEHKNILKLPTHAIAYTAGKAFVWVIDKETKKQKKQLIELGISDDAYTEILSGLREGQSVVVIKKSFKKSKNAQSPFMPAKRKSQNKES